MKYGLIKGLFGVLCAELLRSKRKAKEINKPGTTISPSPSIVNPLSMENRYDFGQRILIGASSEVPTVTI